MSKTTKTQFYRYSLRSVCGRGFQMCGNIFMFEVIPPDNALTIENLFVRLRVTFVVGVAVGDRKIEEIGIVSDFNPFGSTFVGLDHWRKLEINKTADGDRVIDFYIDLSTLLKKENVGDPSFLGGDAPGTFIYIKLPHALEVDFGDGSGINNGSINVWKADAVYTTTEIR